MYKNIVAHSSWTPERHQRMKQGLSRRVTYSYSWGSLVPGPSRGGGERDWYTLHAHAPRKMWGNRILSYTLCLSSIELYVCHAEPANDHFSTDSHEGPRYKAITRSDEITIFILDAENDGERVRLIFLQSSPSVLKTSLGSGSSVRRLGKDCK